MSDSITKTTVRVPLDAVDMAHLQRLAASHGLTVDEMAARIMHQAANLISDGGFESLFGTWRPREGLAD